MKKNKKTYLQPKARVVEIQHAELICASPYPQNASPINDLEEENVYGLF